MSPEEKAPHNPTMADELVAYLDGELDPESNRIVERRLSQDPEYREHLRELEQTWDLLDHLPEAEVDDAFTQSTIAMVAVSTAEDMRDVAVRESRMRRVHWCAIGLGAVLTLLLGFATTRWLTTAADRRLIRDLPVIENVDHYRYAEDIEFLRMLDQAGLFADGEELDHDF